MKTCVRCGSEGRSAYAFRKADPETRAAWRKADIRPIKARSLCVACYDRLSKVADVLDYESERTPGDMIREEWERFADPTRSIRSECQRLAKKFGMNWRSLEKAVARAGIRSRAIA